MILSMSLDAKEKEPHTMIRSQWRIATVAAWGLALAWGLTAVAQDEKKEEEKKDAPAAEAKPAEGPKSSVEIIHLDNPSGVAVHPTTKEIFVVSHQGVFRLVRGKPRKLYLEIDGFPTDEYGKGPVYQIGPLGCTFWGNDRLIVADGSRKDGEELVRVYKIDAAPPEKPRKEDAAEFTLGPIAPGDLSPKGEGNFYGVVVWNDAIYVTSNGDDTKGWVAKSAIADGKPGTLTPTIATKVATEVDAPIGITVTPDKSQLVVSQGGEVNVAGDSLLTFYDAQGNLAKKYKTGLNDITGVAYCPSGKLYGVDYSWVDAAQGGLFELVIEGDEVKPKKILSLDRPTSLTFDSEGALYITVFGLGEMYKAPAGTDAAEEEKKPKGGLIRLEPGL